MRFVRAQSGQDLKTSKSAGVGAAQTEQAMNNNKLLLIEAGSSLQHICKSTIHIIDPHYREAVYPVVGRHLKGAFPVSSGTVVSVLAWPEWLIKVDAMAVISEA